MNIWPSRIIITIGSYDYERMLQLMPQENKNLRNLQD